jgi:Holliday junction resolvasome RuvABC endonuclease subunit
MREVELMVRGVKIAGAWQTKQEEMEYNKQQITDRIPGRNAEAKESITTWVEKWIRMSSSSAPVQWDVPARGNFQNII